MNGCDLMEEIARLREDRDRLIEEAKDLMRERDHARTCAEEMRDLYAAEIDESKKAFPWPWEDYGDETGENDQQ